MSDNRKRLVAVLGTPCGGTNHTRYQLAGNNIPVHHERVGPDGIVCGFALWSDVVPRKVKLYDYEYQHWVRLVRHPLKVAQTLPTYIRLVAGKGPWGEHEDKRVLSLRYWVHTHERIGADWPCIRIERFDEDFPEVCRMLGGKGQINNAMRHSKQVRYDPLGWRDWERLDPEYASRGRDLCRNLRVPDDF